jgi:hypothetical protein
LLTCQNEENGERKTWKESDEGKKRRNSKPVITKSYIELKF